MFWLEVFVEMFIFGVIRLFEDEEEGELQEADGVESRAGQARPSHPRVLLQARVGERPGLRSLDGGGGETHVDVRARALALATSLAPRNGGAILRETRVSSRANRHRGPPPGPPGPGWKMSGAAQFQLRQAPISQRIMR